MRLAKLMRYASKKDLEFYRLGILELEMHLIMIFDLVILFFFDQFYFDIPEEKNYRFLFSLYSYQIDELLKRRTISDLTAYLKNETAYGEILSQVKE